MAIKTIFGGDRFLDERTDDELVELARLGGSQTGAWEELYRRHSSSARGVARHILRSRQDAEDVVNDAFAGVISAIGRGAGPRINFRHYLMACVRNGCKYQASRGKNSVSTDPNVLEHRHAEVFEDAEQFGEARLVASAFSSLSTDWQRALWLTAVEERPTGYVARELGRRPGAVAALVFRAREGFAEAYLRQHQQRTSSPVCVRISARLSQYVRGRAGEVEAARVEHHLSRCVECSRTVAELRDVNSSLRSIALPISVIGGGALVATAAPVAGIGAAVGIAGWASSVLGGAALVKAAAVAALVVPAAVVVTESERPRAPFREQSAAVSVETSVGAATPGHSGIGTDVDSEITELASAAAGPDQAQLVRLVSTGSVTDADSAPTATSVPADPNGPASVDESLVVDSSIMVPSIVAAPTPTASSGGADVAHPISANAGTVAAPSTGPGSPGHAIGSPVAGPAVIGSPVVTTPAVSGPAMADPVVTTPADPDPADTDPAVADPAVDPAVGDPADSDPAVADPAVDPAVADPAAADPTLADPADADQAVVVHPAVAESVVGGHQADADPAVVVDPPVGGPPVGDPPVGDPAAVADPVVVVDPPAGGPAVADPAVVVDPPVGDPPGGDPPVGGPPVGDPSAVAADPAAVVDPPVADPAMV